jgi:hypothetical protein
MAQIEMNKGKKLVSVFLVDVEGWAKAGYSVKQDAYNSLSSDSEKEYVKASLLRAGSAKSEDGE